MRRVVDRVGRQRHRRGRGSALDQAHALGQVGEGVLALEQGHDAHRGAAVDAFGDGQEVGEGVHPVQAPTGPVGDQLAPGALEVDLARQQPEVGGVLVGDLEPPALPAAVAQVLDAVLDVLSAGLEQGERRGRVEGVDVVVLRGARRGDGHHDDLVVAAAPDRHVVLRVLLAEHEDVIGGRRADLVAPELPGSHRLVDAGVEEVAAVARPGEAVVDVVERVVERRLPGQGAHADVMALVALEVDPDGHPSVVRAHRQDPHRQEVATGGLDVLVQDDLLAGDLDRRIDLGRGVVAGDDREATADGVVESLAGALVVPPVAAAHRHRDVGLLDARLDLVEEFGLERGQVRQPLGHEGVLGAQVAQHLLALAVHQPVVGIDPGVPVTGNLEGALRGARRGRHPSTLPEPAAGAVRSVRRVTTMAVGQISRRPDDRRQLGFQPLPVGLV